MQQVYELIIPETVEALKLTIETESWVLSWTKGVIMEDIHPVTKARRILGVYVPTLGGVKEARYGCYVIRKRNGDFCMLQAAQFEAKYRLVR